MASNVTDSLSKRQEQELAHLRRGSPLNSTRLLAIGFVCLIAILLLVRLLGQLQGSNKGIDEARTALTSTGLVWAQNFSDSQEKYQGWLYHHGTSLELSIFKRISEGLFRSAANTTSHINDLGQLGIFSRVYLGLHAGILRMVFIVLACARLWILAVGAAIFFGFRSLKVYTARDILGQTGNGRLFFSGMRVSLDNPTPDGAPADQVTGLACPGTTSLIHAKSSELYKVLEHFNAVTATNLRLIGIIEFHKNYPAYVAMPDDDLALQKYFSGAQLNENCARLLDGALALHDGYRAKETAERPQTVDVAALERGLQQGTKITAEQNVELVLQALDRVLTSSQRETLGLLDPPTLATIILALEAGKSMAYAFEGGKWLRKSNFPQLCARAVLHSIPEFAQEYDFDLRTTIRRAIVFGSRSSMFAPVKFPVEFRGESRAARQWVEVLMAIPTELTGVADEVQLLGLLTELHSAWESVFLDGAEALDPEVIDQVFATPQNLIFMPVQRIIRLLRRVADRPTLQLLEKLVASVSQRQRLRMKTRQNGDDDEAALPAYDRILIPFTPHQMKELVDIHGITVEEAREWSVLRLVLSSYSWLGRRIADRSVPETSIVFTVFSNASTLNGANTLGLLGRPGMVPLRVTRLSERWGKQWASRFMSVGPARMAENRKDFEALLAGITEEPEKEEVLAQPVVQGNG